MFQKPTFLHVVHDNHKQVPGVIYTKQSHVVDLSERYRMRQKFQSTRKKKAGDESGILFCASKKLARSGDAKQEILRG